MGRVTTGLEQVVAGEVRCLAGKRLGLLAAAAAVDRNFCHAADLFHHDRAIDLKVLFGPEHGLRGAVQYMVAVADDRDQRTALPVYSLYGETRESLSPPAEALNQIDALVIDLQDVGARYYTYVWTAVLAMRKCAAAGLEVIVLDRPNPLGGIEVEGGAIERGYESFVGLCSLPNRHGMTLGEILGWIRQREALDVALEVVAMKGWRRSMSYADTGLPWVMPSPNMPTCDTALVYPGMCLLEGTELSEGRGTTRPFEIAGAPHIDGHALARRLDADHLPGVRFRPLTFVPTFDKFAGQICGGVQLHVTEPQAFRPYLTGVAFLGAVKSLWPDQFAWRRRPYEFVTDKPAIDLLTGSSQVRAAIDRDDNLATIAATWEDAERELIRQRQPWLLYS